MKDMPEYSVQLGNVVKEARAKSGISQSKLAASIDATNRTVLNIENGRGNPKLAVLYPLVRELNSVTCTTPPQRERDEGTPKAGAREA